MCSKVLPLLFYNQYTGNLPIKQLFITIKNGTCLIFIFVGMQHFVNFEHTIIDVY